ncbi:hypothetical protein BJV74DRAFT_452604 [Russula compacta]|nr:hypothetical protein BJV74DRAFT_452604 [Russula compacta]
MLAPLYSPPLNSHLLSSTPFTPFLHIVWGFVSIPPQESVSLHSLFETCPIPSFSRSFPRAIIISRSRPIATVLITTRRYRRSMQSVTFSASPSSPQSSGAILADVQQRSPRATWTHVQGQCDMGPRGLSSPYHSVAMTVLASHTESRVENSALIQSSSPRIDRLHTLHPAHSEGQIPSPLSAISSDQYNYQFHHSQDGRLPLNGFPQAPISEISSGYSGAPQLSHESSGLSSTPSSYHDHLNPPTLRPRTSNQVFHSTSDLAAHHGIPQSLPPPPRTTPRRSSESEQIPDLSLSTLCSNYLTMLASNKISEQTPIPEDNSNAALPMSPDDQAAAQAIASALSGTADSCYYSTLSLNERFQPSRTYLTRAISSLHRYRHGTIC